MIVSTKGRYALRVLIDLAENSKESYVSLKDIAERQGISHKYIETIMTLLSKNNIVEGIRGKGGGYRLSRKPEDYKIGEILKITEETLAPVACLEDGAPDCPRKNDCRTLPLWQGLNDTVSAYFDSKTLADFVKTTACI